MTRALARIVPALTVAAIAATAAVAGNDLYQPPYLSIDPSGRWAHYVITDPKVAPVGSQVIRYRGQPDGSGSDMQSYAQARAMCEQPHDGVSGWHLPTTANETQPIKATDLNRAWGLQNGVVGRFWRSRMNPDGTNPDFDVSTGFEAATAAQQAGDIGYVNCFHAPYKPPKR